jgi:hypothetical protein
MRARFTASRVIAGLLALGGVCWGVLLIALIPHAEHAALPLLVFGPGYVVTVGYLIRTVTTPPLRARQVIWVLSLLVQGGWLTWHVVGTLASSGPIHKLTEPRLVVAWWLIATAASIVALIMDSAD